MCFEVQVKDPTGWYASWEQAKPSVATGKSKLDSTMFPPVTVSVADASEKEVAGEEEGAGATASAPQEADAAADEEEGAENEKAREAVVQTPPHTHGHPLELCMRFLPHHQDTGGFFVAVLEKVRECADLVVPQNAKRAARDAHKKNGKGGDGNGKRVCYCLCMFLLVVLCTSPCRRNQGFAFPHLWRDMRVFPTACGHCIRCGSESIRIDIRVPR